MIKIMMSEDNQLEIRKLLKRLGINSQQQLIKYLEENPDKKDFQVKVNFEIDGMNYYNFEDRLKIK
jgi:arginine repressor